MPLPIARSSLLSKLSGSIWLNILTHSTSSPPARMTPSTASSVVSSKPPRPPLAAAVEAAAPPSTCHSTAWMGGWSILQSTRRRDGMWTPNSTSSKVVGICTACPGATWSELDYEPGGASHGRHSETTERRKSSVALTTAIAGRAANSQGTAVADDVKAGAATLAAGPLAWPANKTMHSNMGCWPQSELQLLHGSIDTCRVLCNGCCSPHHEQSMASGSTAG